MAEAGNPSDPIERMLVQQTVLLHHTLGLLHSKIGMSEHSREVKVYTAEAARMTAELSRLTMTLKRYREPSRPRAVQFVRQQNVATHQQVAMVDPQPASADSNAVAATNSESAETRRMGHEPLPTVPLFGGPQVERREAVPMTRQKGPESPTSIVSSSTSENTAEDEVDEAFIFPRFDE